MRKYDSDYSVINMNKFPGEMSLPGATLKAQAVGVDYQDIPRDIQMMRQQTYNKEVKEGEFVNEFSAWTKEFGGLGDWIKEFGAWTSEFAGLNGLSLGTSLVGLLVVGGIGFAAYKYWPKKAVAARRRKRSR
jgi:hypothetical protein